MWKFFPWY